MCLATQGPLIKPESPSSAAGKFPGDARAVPGQQEWRCGGAREERGAKSPPTRRVPPRGRLGFPGP